jgi:hypothetical protein
MDVIPVQTLEPGDDVGRDGCVGVPDMRVAIDVENRRGDVEPSRPARSKRKRTSFLKKRSKKLLLIAAHTTFRSPSCSEAKSGSAQATSAPAPRAWIR